MNDSSYFNQAPLACSDIRPLPESMLVAACWQWNNYDSARARLELNALIKKRGEAVHRSKALSAGIPAAHLIQKDEWERP